MQQLSIILASASPARLKLLKQINITPKQIIAANIDESEFKGELPAEVAKRLCLTKAQKIALEVESGIIIAADTVIAKGRTTLPKAETVEQVRYCLETLQGRRHRAYTGVCIIRKDLTGLIIRKKVVQTIVQIKKLSSKEIDFYCQTKEGLGKAGGYSIIGFAESFVSFISGSYSNVIGLPLFETVNMLRSVGFNLTDSTDL